MIKYVIFKGILVDTDNTGINTYDYNSIIFDDKIFNTKKKATEYANKIRSELKSNECYLIVSYDIEEDEELNLITLILPFFSSQQEEVITTEVVM